MLSRPRHDARRKVRFFGRQRQRLGRTLQTRRHRPKQKKPPPISRPMANGSPLITQTYRHKYRRTPTHKKAKQQTAADRAATKMQRRRAALLAPLPLLLALLSFCPCHAEPGDLGGLRPPGFRPPSIFSAEWSGAFCRGGDGEWGEASRRIRRTSAQT